MSNVIQMAIDDPVSAGAHTLSVSTFAASIAGYIPMALAIIPAIYYLILIYESRTVQHWVANRRMKRAARKLAKLNAAKMIVEAEIKAAETLRLARVDARETKKVAENKAVMVAADAAAALDEYEAKCKRRRADGPTPCLMCVGDCLG